MTVAAHLLRRPFRAVVVIVVVVVVVVVIVVAAAAEVVDVVVAARLHLCLKLCLFYYLHFSVQSIH